MTPLQEALAPRSDQLNADDLIAGPRTIKITEARVLDAGREGKKIVVRYEGDNGKPWKPCKTMGRAMVMVWGITDEEQFAGKALTLYRDPEVKFGDQGAVGGIRISHMSHIDGPRTMKLTVSQGKKGNFTFKPLTAEVREMKPQEDAARKWTDTFIADVNKQPVIDALESMLLRGEKHLASLAKKRPELHAECLHAITMKRESFGVEGGRSDEEFGDQFSEGDE